ncbi:MAG: ABC-three component system protein [Janthinobacterium lividum]
MAKLLRKPEDLKEQLFENWERYCLRKITTTQDVDLAGPLRSYIEGLDFSIFGYKPLIKVLEEHQNTPYYVARFGLGLPLRPVNSVPPAALHDAETRYVEQLLEAYGDNAGTAFQSHSGLPDQYDRHFKRARESFYAAESLRNFSRDTLPEGTFDHLQQQIYAGVVDVCEDEYDCGLTRLKATTREAGRLQLTSSPLIGKTDVVDLHGICHQLANDDRLTWVPGEDGGNLG